MRSDVCVAAVALVLLLYACSNDPLPIGTSVQFSKSAACAPTEIGLDEVLKAQRNGDLEFYKAMDRVQAIEVNAGDSASVISNDREKVRVRLPEGSVSRLRDKTCWILREAIAK